MKGLKEFAQGLTVATVLTAPATFAEEPTSAPTTQSRQERAANVAFVLSMSAIFAGLAASAVNEWSKMKN